MGGAAVGGILATGLGGAGVAVGATVAGALDVGAGEEAVPDLKERFLTAWKLQTVEEAGKNEIVEVKMEGKEKVKREAKPNVKTRLLQTLQF
jgi:outer membrane lipoprotein SlyB